MVIFQENQQTQSPHVYRSRIRTEPTSVTAPQWTASLWSKLESLVEDISLHCIRVRACCRLSALVYLTLAKIYTLEKVLKLKKDTVTQTIFLDEAMKVRNRMPA
jgi:hypothetical protein